MGVGLPTKQTPQCMAPAPPVFAGQALSYRNCAALVIAFLCMAAQPDGLSAQYLDLVILYVFNV